MEKKDKTAWVRSIKKDFLVSAIGTVSFRTVIPAYIEMENVKIIRLIAKSGTGSKESEELIEGLGVMGVNGDTSEFIINYRLEKDADLNDINPFNVAALSDIITKMEEKLSEFYDKHTRISNPSDLPISLLEIEVNDPKFKDIAKLEDSRLDIRFITQKAENDSLKDDIYKKHRDHKLEYLFEHGFKRYTLNCCMVIETLKRFSKEKDTENAIIYWSGMDDIFPKTDYNLWLYIHNHYIKPRDFVIEKKLIVFEDDKLSLDGYKWR